MSDSMTLAQLAEASGLPARTIRFYIARGLLEGPRKAGRGAAYTQDHLACLERIKRLQSEGRMLSEIGRALGGAEMEPAVAPPTAWWRHALADDVVVLTKSDLSPWRARQLHAALEEFARSVRKPDNGDRKE